MPDIFLSYNREDQAAARRFAEAFERERFSVWWDVSLRAGEAYDRITEQALSDAKAVVVLWSPRSVESRWVRAEATQAVRDSKLVPVMIENCKRPIMFELTQTADLTHWKGDPHDTRWLAFLADVKAIVHKQPSATPKPQPASATSWAPPSIPRRTLVIGAIALAAVFAAAIGAVMLLGQGSGAPTSQRVAFFGFTSDGGPLADDIAASATDETYQTMLAMRLETGARTATRGVEPSQQRQRAGELGAAYILGGEVRQTGERISISMRLEDVASSTTLWEDTVAGATFDRISLPVMAAGAATAKVRCISSLRASLPRPDGNVRNLIAAACDGDGNWTRQQVDVWRDLAKQAQHSAFVQSQFASGLYGFQSTPVVMVTEWPGLLEEARNASRRATELDPGGAHARSGGAMDAIAEGRPLAEAGELLANNTNAPDDWRKGIPSRARSRLLAAVGRNVAAVSSANAAVEFDPLAVNSRLVLSVTLARVGRWPEAEREFEQSNARHANSLLWQTWFFYAALLDPGSTSEVLAKAPPAVPDATRTCWQEIAESMQSRSALDRRRGTDLLKQCRADDLIDPISGAGALANLGDVQGAFEALKRPLDRRNPLVFLSAAGVLFSPQARVMRADPQFLSLIQELGIFQYWLDTKTRPDVCDKAEEQGFAFCVALRASQPPN